MTNDNQDLTLLTAAQVAERLGISRSYCTRLLRRLGVPRVALGHRTVRFRPADVDAAIARAATLDGGV